MEFKFGKEGFEKEADGLGGSKRVSRMEVLKELKNICNLRSQLVSRMERSQ